ncbi:amino acid permease/ SLC12A domain-containing protein [Aspergillus californicus]
MIAHTYNYTSRHLGFAISYLRWCSLAVFIPFEVTTAMVHSGLWNRSSTIALRMGLVMAVMFGFNMLPDKIFRRSQALFTGIKFLAAIGVIIIAIILSISATPESHVRGFLYWRDPGTFNEFLLRGGLGRLLGVLDCLLCSTIAFVFIPELTVQRAEQRISEPQNSIYRQSRNSNLVFLPLYIFGAVAATTMTPYNDEELTNYGAGAGLSPFVLGIRNSGIRVLPMIMTGLILLSSVASGRSFLNISSRMLASMAETGHAPSMFMVRNRWKVPYMSVGITAGFSWLAYLCLVTSSSVVHNYLMFFITTSGYLSWMCSSIAYLQFRQVLKKAGITPQHRSILQPYGTWFTLVASACLILLNLAQIVVAPRYQFDPYNAIPGYISVAMFVIMYGGHRLITAIRNKTSRLEAPPVEVRSEVDEDPTPDQAIEMQPQTREVGSSTPGGEPMPLSR